MVDVAAKSGEGDLWDGLALWFAEAEERELEVQVADSVTKRLAPGAPLPAPGR